MVDKVVSVLDALEGGPLSLSGLQSVTGLPRATAHRLACALADHGLVARDGEGRFLLGPRLYRRSLADAAAPALAALRDATGESTQLYVPEVDGRRCVVSLESPHSLRTIVAVGALLPVDRGSAGAVLRGDPTVLRRGWAQSVEEREVGVASVSAPVYRDGAVVAAVSVSGPVGRTTRTPGRRYSAAVMTAARAVEAALAYRTA